MCAVLASPATPSSLASLAGVADIAGLASLLVSCCVHLFHFLVCDFVIVLANVVCLVLTVALDASMLCFLLSFSSFIIFMVTRVLILFLQMLFKVQLSRMPKCEFTPIVGTASLPLKSRRTKQLPR